VAFRERRPAAAVTAVGGAIWGLPVVRTPRTRRPRSSSFGLVRTPRPDRLRAHGAVWVNAVAVPKDIAAGSGIKQQVAIAADPKGRAWVGWRDADSGRSEPAPLERLGDVRRSRLDRDPGAQSHVLHTGADGTAAVELASVSYA
jgi:hypothetical protein